MKFRLVVRPEAEAELEEAAVWYEDSRPGLGVAFVAAVDEALAAIVETPEAYPRWQAGYPYRKYVLRRFPYVIFFAAEDSTVRVVAFTHVKRRPGYWLRRLPSGS